MNVQRSWAGWPLLGLMFASSLHAQPPRKLPPDVLFQKGDVMVRLVGRNSGFRDPNAPPHRNIMVDGIHYGLQFLPPEDPQQHLHPSHDWRRFPTTYYHAKTPAGIVLDRTRWFPAKNRNTYSSDARLPASLTGGLHPWVCLATAFSQPAVGVIGTGPGTIAAYAQPYQHMVFYEHRQHILSLSVPEPGQPMFFTFLHDAKQRGALIDVHSGSARELLEKRPHQAYFHTLIVEAVKGGIDQKLQEPLLTQEGLKLLANQLTDDGILCYHISNRYYRLETVIADTADSLGLAWKFEGSGYGLDFSKESPGAFSASWFLVAKNRQAFQGLTFLKDRFEQRSNPASGHFVWRDGKTPYAGLYMSDPHLVAHLRQLLQEVSKFLPASMVRYDSNFQRALNGLLTSLDRSRVAQLNRGGPKLPN